MKIYPILTVAAIALVAGACSHRADINGAWTSTPVRVADDIAVADDATSVLSIDFNAPKGAKSGLFLDNSTMQVNVDPNGVTFSQNLLTGAQQPMVDSLTSVTADRWRTAIRTAAAKQFFSFTKLDDVKVVNDILSCEAGKKDLTFHRAGTPE